MKSQITNHIPQQVLLKSQNMFLTWRLKICIRFTNTFYLTQESVYKD